MNYEDEDLCQRCPGPRCCNQIPGILKPEDVKVSLDYPCFKERITALLKTGWYSIDCYDGDPREGIKPVLDTKRRFYLRPATKEGHGKIFDNSWGGACFFLKKSGCALLLEDRPWECRELEPKILEPRPEIFTRACISHHHPGFDTAKQEAVLSWEKYSDALYEIGKAVMNGQQRQQ